MTRASWSAAGDLIRVAGASTLEDACARLGIIGPSTSVTIDEEPAWRRAGSETYQLKCVVAAADGGQRSVLFKACVAYEPDSTAGIIAEKWLARRASLAALNVQTPKLYGMVDATVIEEWIDHSLIDVLGWATADAREAIARQLGTYAGALSALRFCPIDAFADLRSRGNDVVAVDFGEDLGPPGMSSSPLGLRLAFEALAALESAGVGLSEDETRLLLDGFESVEGASTTTRPDER